ncbi:uncharacterized protein LOC132740269 [Ruditapes philippinarum]|uniref:uncharacterized protein LOC132740269 n=1 Tax=Ruditapes philippinarum TaxID=129788 RepID=UPI00295B0D07|nr:uncharacterized protein LOC132740269 [Ruditapes philippinarum]
MATGGRLTHSKINDSDEVIDYACSPCTKRNKTNDAVRFCVECQEFLCSLCVDNHNSFSALTGHILLDKSQFGSLGGSTAPNVLPLPTERCKVHLTKLVDMYCANHDAVGCSICLNIDHRSCQDVHYVPTYVQGLKPSFQTSSLKSQVNATIVKLESLLKRYKDTRGEFDTKRVSSLKDIQEFRKEINKTLDRLEQASIQNINKQYKDLDLTCENEMADIQRMLGELKRSKMSLESSVTNVSQQFVVDRKCKCDVVDSGSLLERSMIHRSKFIPFKGNTDFFVYINTFHSLDQSVQQTAQKIKPKKTLYELKSADTFDIRLPTNEGPCEIRSMCILDSGDILVTDNSNKALKLIDGESYNVKDSIKVPNGPSGVCKGRIHEAVVCLERTGIQFVSTKEKLVLTQTLSMNHICLGVCMISSCLYVTDGQNRNIFKYDFNGKLLKKISGDTIFSWNRYLADSYDGKSLYVTDRDNGLLKLDLEGNVIWKQPANIFESAYGVCTDGLDVVFVTGYNSNNVVQVASDGTCLGEVISKNRCVIHASAVCFDRLKSKLIVAGEDTGIIHVYSLE